LVINRAKLVLDLSTSGLSQAKSACEAIRNENTEVSKLGESIVNSDEIASIYKRRAKHLERFQTPHANQLSVSVRELLTNLEEVEGVPVSFCEVSTKHEHSFSLFVSIDTGKILGCFKTVSRLDVGPERWEEIWYRSMGDEET
jgi:hypothetical protein